MRRSTPSEPSPLPQRAHLQQTSTQAPPLRFSTHLQQTTNKNLSHRPHTFSLFLPLVRCPLPASPQNLSFFLGTHQPNHSITAYHKTESLKDISVHCHQAKQIAPRSVCPQGIPSIIATTNMQPNPSQPHGAEQNFMALIGFKH